MAKRRTAQEEVIGQLTDLVDSAAKDAGWGSLERKPYPSDPKLRNCESVGAFVGSLRRGVRDIIRTVGALIVEGKIAAENRADILQDLGKAQLAASNSGGMIEHDAAELKDVG